MEEIDERVKAGDRVLVTTLSKRMAEDLAEYFVKFNIRCRYIHSEVDTLERVEILRQLRLGEYDVLIGINLLREGLDLPEVSLVAILDADKEGFLRNTTSLTQTAGRAARNSNGKVIFYADTITESMRRTIDETTRRRSKQMAYNEEHGITPTTVFKSKEQIMKQTSVADARMEKEKKPRNYEIETQVALAADPVVEYMTAADMEKSIDATRERMMKAAKEMNFTEAARLRDEMYAMIDLAKSKFGLEISQIAG